MKDFDPWNEEKKVIHEKGDARLYRSRDIWWVALGTNVGTEIDGTGKQYDRPVIVIKGFNANQCFVVPLTGRRRESCFYMSLGLIENREASAVLSQVRIIDTKRFVKKIGMIEKTLFNKLIQRLIGVLFLQDHGNVQNK